MEKLEIYTYPKNEVDVTDAGNKDRSNMRKVMVMPRDALTIFGQNPEIIDEW